MNILDIFIIAVFTILTLIGIFKGLIRLALSWASLIIAYLTASLTYPLSADFFGKWIINDRLADIAGFAAVFIAVILIGTFIIWLLRNILKKIHLLWLDRLCGGALGFLMGITVCVIVIMLLTAYLSDKSTVVKNSVLAPEAMKVARFIVSIVPGKIKENFKSKSRKIQDYWKDLEKQKHGKNSNEEIQDT